MKHLLHFVTHYFSLWLALLDSQLATTDALLDALNLQERLIYYRIPLTHTTGLVFN